ncbi:serine/threonine-protein kinase [Modestobacter sp. Leaf380]|uniref:serine/threonine-protein kinase n=1 Tax=Modestobacter sp. Leaf380 TaxID=1736356 RepID=UPI0006FDE345|nr:serine/threonine-protein kinase [Modestobacter sp. Leaf380]KQS66218.1 hypothetical protein ASG41_12890 [Modestobacter sp. Leaf380]
MEPGRQFGPYLIEGLIGRGGMGEVYRAQDTEHQRVVALKVLPEHLAADPDYRERFRREAHAAARLAEPHVVPIHRYGELEGRLFLDMRLVRGADLATVLERERTSPERAVSLVSQVAAALDAAHDEGLVHRDVKPSNVLLTGTGDDEFAYLVDFGIARSTADAQATALTQTGAALGSFDYMAPERFLDAPVDARADVYALACVLHECLTGRRPFTGTGLPALMWAHLNAVAPAPSTLDPRVPPALDAVVARGLAKDPAQRFARAGELAAAARAALRSAGIRPVPAAPAPGPPVPPRAQTIGFTGPPHTPAPWHPVPSGPGWPTAPPPTAVPPARGTSPALVVALVVTVVVALLVVGAVVLTRGGGSGSSADPTPTPTVATTSTTDAPSTTSAEQTGSTPAGSDAEAELRAALPADFDADSCTTRDLPDDGAIAALDCGATVSGEGPAYAAFYLYPDEGTLSDVFAADVGGLGLDPLPSGSPCPGDDGAYGHRDWTQDGVRAGEVACTIGPTGDATLVWTQLDARAEGFAQLPDGTDDDLDALWEWWNDPALSDFTV